MAQLNELCEKSKWIDKHIHKLMRIISKQQNRNIKWNNAIWQNQDYCCLQWYESSSKNFCLNENVIVFNVFFQWFCILNHWLHFYAISIWHHHHNNTFSNNHDSALIQNDFNKEYNTAKSFFHIDIQLMKTNYMT